ncbi:MAG: Sec-independent protein translocase protein TatC [Chloroflexi bacterium]|nr:Sec-independent protein translocase protein TatC [Chloroflexota bacterium]
MSEEALPQSGMSLLEHLGELQKRLVKSAIVLIVAGAGCFFISKPILGFLLAPMGEYPVIAPRPTTSIGIFMRISLLSGVVVALPFITYQLLGFITPGLTRKERRSLYWIIPAVTLFFLLGGAFAYFVMIPAAIPFLLGFLSDVIQPTWMVDEYIPFILSLIFWVGVSFEMPLVCYFLAHLNIVTSKQLLSGWKFAAIAIAILAAGITPTPDPFNMMLVMLPLLGLYFLGIFLAWIAGRRKQKNN